MENYETFNEFAVKQLNKVGYLSQQLASLTVKNKPFLIEKGWRECPATGAFAPKELFVESYRNYNEFLDGNPRLILKSYSETCAFDTYLNQRFFGDTIDKRPCYINDKKEILTASHVNYKLDSGELFTTRAMRNYKIITDFNTHYYDHHGSNKNWNIPKGHTYGLELELKFPSAISKLRFSQELHNKFPDWGCERDGSLEDIEGEGNAGEGGLELISPPLNFETLVEVIPKVCTLIKKYKGIGHDTGSPEYGLHITAKMNTEDQNFSGSNIMRFFHDHDLEDFFRNFARREKNEFCSAFGNVEHELKKGLANSALRPLNYFTEDYNKDNHHRATCVRKGEKCIETRIFRSTVNPRTIIASLELIHLINLKSIDNYDTMSYINFVVDKASRILGKYIEDSGSNLSLEYLRSKKNVAKKPYNEMED